MQNLLPTINFVLLHELNNCLINQKHLFVYIQRISLTQFLLSVHIAAQDDFWNSSISDSKNTGDLSEYSISHSHPSSFARRVNFPAWAESQSVETEIANRELVLTISLRCSREFDCAGSIHCRVLPRDHLVVPSRRTAHFRRLYGACGPTERDSRPKSAPFAHLVGVTPYAGFARSIGSPQL